MSVRMIKIPNHVKDMNF